MRKNHTVTALLIIGALVVGFILGAAAVIWASGLVSLW
jgi:hypothetical protein